MTHGRIQGGVFTAANTKPLREEIATLRAEVQAHRIVIDAERVLKEAAGARADAAEKALAEMHDADHGDCHVLINRYMAERDAEKARAAHAETEQWARVWEVIATLGIESGGCPDHQITQYVDRLRAALRQIAARGCSVLGGCPGEARCAACVARQALEGK